MYEMLSEPLFMPPKNLIQNLFFYILADDIWIQEYCLLHQNKTKTPLSPPPKKPNNKLPIFYRAIMVILERVNIKKTYKYLRLTDSKSSYITPSGSWMS